MIKELLGSDGGEVLSFALLSRNVSHLDLLDSTASYPEGEISKNSKFSPTK